jgi:hypothetical protein
LISKSRSALRKHSEALGKAIGTATFTDLANDCLIAPKSCSCSTQHHDSTRDNQAQIQGNFLAFRDDLMKSTELVRPHWTGIQVLLTDGHVTPTEVK